jgi:hypothetical protein
MEYCNGGDLADYLHGTNRFGKLKISNWFSQICKMANHYLFFEPFVLNQYDHGHESL